MVQSGGLNEQLTPFCDMLEKGIIHVPQRDELLSISDVCLGMKSPPSDVYIRHGINGHHYRYPHDDHSSMVTLADADKDVFREKRIESLKELSNLLGCLLS